MKPYLWLSVISANHDTTGFSKYPVFEEQSHRYRPKSSRLYRRQLQIINNLSSLTCTCPTDLCDSLPPSEAILTQDTRICHCNPFTLKIACTKTCQPIANNCIDKYRPVLINRSNFNLSPNAPSPCEECKVIGCVEKETNRTYIASSKFRDGCKICRCPKHGGDLKCKNVCKKSNFPQFDPDYERYQVMETRMQAPIMVEHGNQFRKLRM